MKWVSTRKNTDTKLLSEVYTSLSDIKRELRLRRKDKKLRMKVEKFFGHHMFSALEKSPRAVLSRTIATPDIETAYYLDLLKDVDLKPLILEYPDKFVAKNKDKYHLCRLFFCRILKNKQSIPVSTVKIVNFNKVEGKNFHNIDTVWGENIIKFHHELLNAEHPQLRGKVMDFSDWFKETRTLSKYYYLYYLSLFVCNGVLFENFLVGDKEEMGFIKDKFLPSFKEVERIFGVKPLIYPLLPLESERNPHWPSYPESIKKRVDKNMKMKLKK